MPGMEGVDPLVSLYDEIRQVLEIRARARRTIFCERHRVETIREAVRREGLEDVFTVRASPACSPGQLLIADLGALDAAVEDWKRKAQEGMGS